PILHTTNGAKAEALLAPRHERVDASEAAEWSGTLDAFGCTFILTPTWSLRLGADDNLLLRTFIRHDCALLLQSEMQTRRTSDSWLLDVAPALCPDACRVLEADNAGGSSLISEAMTMELLAVAFGARLLKTEMELAYFPSESAMTDLAVEIDGVPLGVSVTRAVSRPSSPLSVEAAMRLLDKKMSGILKSTASCYNVSWQKQILHIWARSSRVARVVEEAYSLLEPALKADTLCIVTRCSSLQEMFTEKTKARPSIPKKLKGVKDERHCRILAESDPTRTAIDNIM
ncbi:MAG: hypothetical protein SGPRY_011674, partial [Prymnesium sp.]